jgi:Fe-S-cluster-containing dehydrogenase component
MARYGMVIDISKCTGCYNCFLACRDEFAGNAYPPYSAPQPMRGMNWIKVIERERGQYPWVKVAYTPLTCMQCENAPCVKAAQNEAVYRRGDGIILIDPLKAKGQKQIVNACPYRVIEWNEELELPQKCSLCAHMLDKGEKVPRCVESCPTGALVFGDLDNPASEISRILAANQGESLHPEYGLKEKVSYLHLARKFIAGTVILGDIDEVGKGLKVSLSGNGKTQEATTNGFGDFEFEGLGENSEYTLKVEAPGYQSQTLTAKTSRDIYLGEIVLRNNNIAVIH